MVGFFQSLIIKIFNGNAFWATFFISMIPVIEVKGAIPFGVSKDIFGAGALTPVEAWFASTVGGFIPALFLVWAFIPIIQKLKKTKMFRFLSEKLEQRFLSNAQKIKANAGTKSKRNIKKWLGLFAFVAIPLPLTGVYTGSAIAGFLGIGYIQSLLAILIGNIVAGAIIVLICFVFSGYELYLFVGFIALVLLILVCKIMKKNYAKNKKVETKM